MTIPQEVRAVPASEAVVERIATCEGVGPTELPPLYDTIDTEALDSLVGSAEPSESTLQIEFTYNDYEVTVTGEGVVHIDEETNSPRAIA